MGKKDLFGGWHHRGIFGDQTSDLWDDLPVLRRWMLHMRFSHIPIGSMYGIYTNIWGILTVNVTIYGIHGSYGIWIPLEDIGRNC